MFTAIKTFLEYRKLVAAVRKGDNPQVRCLLQKTPSLLGRPGQEGHSLLHLAVRGGYLDVYLPVKGGTLDLVKYLLDAGADPNAKNTRGETPLHFATHYAEHPDLVNLLLDAGADPNAKSIFGTPLHGAAYEGDPPTVELLLNKGADPDSSDREGSRPLHVAARRDHAKIVELLLGRGANPNAPDAKGNTPLHMAAAHSAETTARILLGRGASVNARNLKGFTALDLVDAWRKQRPTSSRVLGFGGETAKAIDEYVLPKRNAAEDRMSALLRQAEDASRCNGSSGATSPSY